jgi:hypothetical protein
MTPAKWMRAKGYRPLKPASCPKKAGSYTLTRIGLVLNTVDMPNG